MPRFLVPFSKTVSAKNKPCLGKSDKTSHDFSGFPNGFGHDVSNPYQLLEFSCRHPPVVHPFWFESLASPSFESIGEALVKSLIFLFLQVAEPSSTIKTLYPGVGAWCLQSLSAMHRFRLVLVDDNVYWATSACLFCWTRKMKTSAQMKKSARKM